MNSLIFFTCLLAILYLFQLMFQDIFLLLQSLVQIHEQALIALLPLHLLVESVWAGWRHHTDSLNVLLPSRAVAGRGKLGCKGQVIIVCLSHDIKFMVSLVLVVTWRLRSMSIFRAQVCNFLSRRYHVYRFHLISRWYQIKVLPSIAVLVRFFP